MDAYGNLASSTCYHKIAEWNIYTLYQAGKLESVKEEARRFKLDILSVSEARWTGSRNIASGDWIFYYCGGEKHEAGVGSLLQNSIVACWQVSQRVIMVKIAAKPVGLNILQVYAPTGDHSDDSDVQLFYEQLDKVRNQCKSGEVTLVMVDLNAKVGEGCSGNELGPFGLGDRNERGDKWVEWCGSWE